MIKNNTDGVGKFTLVQSSEQGMLAEVSRKTKHKQGIVFLGWEPHPMNTKYDMQYLSGGDAVFGPNYGGATVYTNTTADYVKECPNLGKFLDQLKFNAADGEHHHGLHHVRQAGPRPGGGEVAEGQPGCDDAVARGRHHRWTAVSRRMRP